LTFRSHQANGDEFARLQSLQNALATLRASGHTHSQRETCGQMFCNSLGRSHDLLNFAVTNLARTCFGLLLSDDCGGQQWGCGGGGEWRGTTRLHIHLHV